MGWVWKEGGSRRDHLRSDVGPYGPRNPRAASWRGTPSPARLEGNRNPRIARNKGDIVNGAPKEPLWACPTCPFRDNWFCRLTCSKCGEPTPPNRKEKVLKAAREANGHEIEVADKSGNAGMKTNENELLRLAKASGLDVVELKAKLVAKQSEEMAAKPPMAQAKSLHGRHSAAINEATIAGNKVIAKATDRLLILRSSLKRPPRTTHKQSRTHVRLRLLRRRRHGHSLN